MKEKGKFWAVCMLIALFACCMILGVSCIYPRATDTVPAELQNSYSSDVQEGYFVYNASGASLYAPFNCIAVRTKSGTAQAAETGVKLTLSAPADAEAADYLAVQFVQMTANAQVPISVEINGQAPKAAFEYTLLSVRGISETKNSSDGTVLPTVETASGFTGYIFIPLSAYSEITQIETVSVAASMAQLRIGVGEIYLTTETKLPLSGTVYTPDASSSEAIGDNAEIFALEAGTVRGADSQLTEAMLSAAELSNTEKLSTNYKLDPLMLQFPEEMTEEIYTVSGKGVDYTAIEGMLFWLENLSSSARYWTTYSVIDASFEGDAAVNITNGSMATNNKAKGAFITEADGYQAGANIINIPAAYTGFLYLEISTNSFPACPVTGAPYIFMNVLNNASFAQNELKIVNLQFLTKPLVAELDCDNGITAETSITEVSISEDRKYFTYDIEYSKFKVKPGYSFQSMSFDGEVIAAEDINAYTLEKSSLQSGAHIGLSVHTSLEEYELEYHLNGGTNNELNPATFTVESRFTLYAPKYEGFEFAGWYRSANFAGEPVTEFVPTSEDIGGADLYASWNASDHEYAVLIQSSENGSVVADKEKGKIGDTVIFTFAPDDGYYVKSAFLNGVQIRDNIIDNKYTTMIATEDIRLDVLFGNDECYQIPAGSAYFRVSAAKGSVYSPFASVAARTDIPSGTGGIKMTGLNQPAVSSGAIAFEYYQPVVDVSIPLTITIGDGSAEYGITANAQYYIFSETGNVRTGEAQNGKIVLSASKTKGVNGIVIIPLSQTSTPSEFALSTFAITADLGTYARHAFGKIYYCNAFDADNISLQNVVWDPQEGTYEAISENVTLISLDAGELIGAPNSLTDVAAKDQNVANKQNEIIILNLPDEMKNAEGNVDLDDVKGIVFELVTTSDVRTFPLMAVMDSKYGDDHAMDVSYGWETRNASRSATWIFEGGEMAGTIYAEQSAAVIERNFDGTIVIPFTVESFTAKNASADANDAFPTEIEPYIMIQLLNNTAGCNKSIQIRSITLVDDLAPYETCTLDYSGFNVSVETAEKQDYVLPGTEVTFIVEPKVGYRVVSVAVNDEEVTLSEDMTYTMTVTEDVVFYVVCEAIDYTITYELNGGVNNPDNITTYRSTNASFTLLSPTRDGYIFAGWYDNPDFSGEAIERIVRGSSGDITLYAKWEQEGGCCGTMDSVSQWVALGGIILVSLAIVLKKRESKQ